MSSRVSRGRTVAAALRISFLQFVADPQWLVPSMLALVSYEIFAGQGPTFVLYAVLGASMMSMWGQTLYGSGWATGQDREWGTLEPTLAAPTSYLYVVFGRVTWNTISGLLGGVIVYVVILITYGRPIPLHNPVAFVVLLMFTIVSLAAVGLL